MKSKIGSLVVSLALCAAFSSLGFAEQSPEQKLKEFYDSTNTPALMEDLPTNPFHNPCVIAFPRRPEVSPFGILRMDQVKLPAKPSHGPLFPGAPERFVEHFVGWGFTFVPGPGDISTPVDSDLLIEQASHQTLDFGRWELRVTTGSMDRNNIGSTDLFIKKSGELLAFKVNITSTSTTGAPVQSFLYGYCYKQ